MGLDSCLGRQRGLDGRRHRYAGSIRHERIRFEGNREQQEHVLPVDECLGRIRNNRIGVLEPDHGDDDQSGEPTGRWKQQHRLAGIRPGVSNFLSGEPGEGPPFTSVDGGIWAPLFLRGHLMPRKSPNLSPEVRQARVERMLGNKINLGRKLSKKQKDDLRQIMKGNNFRIGIPHSEEIKNKIRKSMKGQHAGILNPMFGKQRSWSDAQRKQLRSDVASGIRKAPPVMRGEENPRFGISPPHPKMGFSEDLGHIVRSPWEEKIFLFLKTKEIEYEYEPIRFFIKHEDGNMTYMVDSRIKNTNIFIEVKGWCKPLSVLKMTEFRKQYPENKLWIVTSERAIKKVPLACYDRIFALENLNELLEAIKFEQRLQKQA